MRIKVQDIQYMRGRKKISSPTLFLKVIDSMLVSWDKDKTKNNFKKSNSMKGINFHDANSIKTSTQVLSL